MRYVIDASALLAVALEESGAPAAEDAIPGGLLSTVNYHEVRTRLIDWGRDEPAERRAFALIARLTLRTFDKNMAELAAELRDRTRHRGLSLGDRACLALAISEGLPVLTADRNWAEFDLPVDIRLIR